MSKPKQQATPNDGHLINGQITARTMYVIDQSGGNLGALSRADALAHAQQAGLDLVKVGDRDGIPVAKLMDFGKFLYSKKKQSVKAKKTQKTMAYWRRFWCGYYFGCSRNLYWRKRL